MILALALMSIVQCPDGSPPPCSRTAGPGPRSVAVLNFRLLSRDSSDAYLAEGLADAITSRLSQVERLDVASRTAARLGRTPRAAYLVSGTMLRQNQRLVVNVELLRTSSGRNAWAQRYERPDTMVLSLESEIAVAVAGAMLPSVTTTERAALGTGPTRNAEAYDRLLRGDFLLARRSFGNTVRAIQEFEAAARLDPGLAAAHARIGLASALWLDWEWDPNGRPAPDSVLMKGIAAAARALALDSGNSDAWLAKAYVGMWQYPVTQEGVEDAFRRSLALDPRNAEAHHQFADWLFAMNRVDESLAESRISLAIDPLRPVTLRNLGISMGAEGRALLDSSVSLEPESFTSFGMRAYTRLSAGDSAGARADLIRATSMVPPESRVLAAASRAGILLLLGDTAEARATATMALGWISPTGPVGMKTLQLGQVLYGLGHREAALDLLERTRPRGAVLWFRIMGPNTNIDAPTILERVRPVLRESRPPWVR